MSAFLDHAARLFAAAESCVQAGQMPTNTTILLLANGALHLVSESDWTLDALIAHHGANMGYRITPAGSRVRVEGRAGGHRCQFELPGPQGLAKQLQAHLPALGQSSITPPPVRAAHVPWCSTFKRIA